MDIKIVLKDCLNLIEEHTKQICLKQDDKKCCGSGKPFCHSTENCQYKADVIVLDNKPVQKVNPVDHAAVGCWESA